MISVVKLRAAINEAKRFIKKAEEAEYKLKTVPLIYITGSKETASAKRASMDLTRVLSDLRNGQS